MRPWCKSWILLQWAWISLIHVPSSTGLHLIVSRRRYIPALVKVHRSLLSQLLRMSSIVYGASLGLIGRMSIVIKLMMLWIPIDLSGWLPIVAVFGLSLICSAGRHSSRRVVLLIFLLSRLRAVSIVSFVLVGLIHPGSLCDLCLVVPR